MIQFRSMKLIFEWNNVKAKSNLKKHKVGFDEAKEVFSDQFAITFRDEFHAENEDRLITIGMSTKRRTLLVVHTESEAHPNSVIIRIISCRKATKTERAIYEKGE